MSLPHSTFTELVSTTLRNHKGDMSDNVTNHNALLRALNKKGRKVFEDGGNSLVCGLDYQENGTFQRFSGYDALNIAASDVITSAEYNWKNSVVNVTAAGDEIRKNSGSKTRIMNLVEERVNNAVRTMKNNTSTDVYSDGTLSNQINGLQAICPDTAGGSLGGIDGDTWTFWQSVVQSAAAPLTGSSITLSESTFEKFMRQAYIAATRGEDMPDLLLLDNNYYELFEGSQVSNKRYTTDTNLSKDKASAGFVSLKYKSADVYHDGGSGIPASHGFFVNTDYLKYVCHTDADMSEIPEQRSINQDAVVIPMITMHNITCSNRSLQAVLKA